MSKRIVEWTVWKWMLADAGDDKITKQVNKMIEDGWQPTGDPIINDGWFYQTLVKYDDDVAVLELTIEVEALKGEVEELHKRMNANVARTNRLDSRTAKDIVYGGVHG